MNRILPIILAFLSSQIDKLKKILIEFSQIEDDSRVLSLDTKLGFEIIWNRKIKYLFVILVSVFTNSASGQITQPTVWTKAYDTNVTLAYTGLSFPVAAGSNRILVVAITSILDKTGDGTQADPAVITYGGVTLTKAIGNGATSGRTHTWLYYLKDNVVMDGTSRPFNVTGGAISNSRNLANMSVWYTVYAGVDQSATYTTGNGFSNTSSTTAAQLTAPMAVNANEQAVYISSIYNAASTSLPTCTINTNWTSGNSVSISYNTNGEIAWKNEVAKRAIPASNTTDNAATSTINPSSRYAMSAMSLPSLIPAITSLGSTNGCPGTSITINGTNLAGATAVQIGGTNVVSITSNTATQIVAVIGAGTTGAVTVTNAKGTGTSAATFTVNPVATTSNAGVDQTGNSTSFTMAANAPTAGIGAWSIVSGPSTALTQFSDTASPTATFTPVGSGTYVLNWTITNTCTSSSDSVSVTANCVSNLISNGNFSNGTTGWVAVPSKGNPETNSESTYFSTAGNSNSINTTAELDSAASLRQVVTVIPNVSYTVSFLYARRPTAGTPATVAVNVNITGGATPSSLTPVLTTTNTTPKIGTFTFTPTSSSIGIEFYNSLAGSETLGTIIDDIVLIPTSQVAPYATTSTAVFNTTASCAGVSVQLDVKNATASGVTYAWTGTGGAVFSPSANDKNPTVTFTSSGIQQATVTATTAGGCSGIPSTTYVNVLAVPTITTAATPAVVTTVCQSASAQTTTMAYTGTTNTPTSYSIVWTGLANQGSTTITFAGGGGNVTGITVPANTPAGTYTGTMTITNGNGCTATKAITLTVGKVAAAASSSPTLCINTALTAITHSTINATGISNNNVAGMNGLPAGVKAVWALNTITISGTPTASGTFNYTIPLTGTCAGAVNATGTIIVTPAASAGTVTAGISPQCIGGTTTYTVSGQVLGGGTGAWTSDNTAIATVIAGTGVVTAVSAGTCNIVYTVTGGCGGTPTASKPYTVTATANAGTVTAGASPQCIGGTTIYTVSGQVLGGGTGAWTSDNTAIATVIAGTGVVTAVSAGTCNIVYTVTGGCGGTPTASKPYTVTATANAGTVTAGTSPQCIGGTTTYTVAGQVLGGGTGDWSSSNTTIATVSATGLVTGVAAGTANIIYTITGGCGGTVSAQQSVTISPTLPASVTIAAFPSGTICSGTSVTFTATPINEGTTPTYKWYNGATLISGEIASTYTTTTLVNGDAISVVMTSNATPCLTGSPATSNTVTMTVTTLPTAPTITLTQPNCVASGTIKVTSPAYTAGIVYTVIGTNPVVGAVSNITGEFPGLAAGDYSVTYQIGSGCASSVKATTLLPSITNTWNGTAWSGGTPNASQSLIFGDNYSSATSIIGCSCEVTAGKTVTIESGGIMTIINSVVNDGTLIFENSASLVQVNDAAVNSGNIIYRRTTSTMKKFDYAYWSSPVADQKLNVLSPNSAGFYYSFDKDNWVKESGGATMNDAGKGFIIRVPNPNVTYPNSEGWSGPTYQQSVQFVGVPYNGIKTIVTQGALQNNLIGNPYPSAILADDFIDENETIIGGALYFWTHNTARAHVGNKFVYVSDDYATYTLAGGTGTDPALSGGAAPSGYIAAGQSFFIRSKTDGSFEFNNSMRVSDPGRNSDFFKMGNTKKVAATAKVREKNRVWLNLRNAGGAFKQLLVGYIEGATDEVDNLYDGVTYDGNTYIDFYSINSEKKLTVQGRGLPFKETDRVPLGYKTNIAGTFDISIDHVDGIMANKIVYLEDKTTGVTHNLNQGTYSFSTQKGEFQDRFVLSYASSSLGTDDFEGNEKSLVVLVKQHQIKIHSFDEMLSKVKVYDLRGRLLYKNDQLNGNEFTIPNFNSGDQFLVVMTQLTNGQWISKEIIFKN